MSRWNPKIEFDLLSVGFWATWETLTKSWFAAGAGMGMDCLERLPFFVTRATQDMMISFPQIKMRKSLDASNL